MTQKKHSLIKATIVVSLLAIIGKILGFGRQALIAAYFGATAETDVFFLTQELPHMIFPSVGSSFALGFTTLYVRRMEQQGVEEGDRFASRMLKAMFVLGVGLSLLGVLTAPLLVSVFAPGFTQEQHSLGVHLSRLTMGAFILTIMNYMLGAVLNSKKHFYGGQMAALAHNIAIIAGVIVLGRGQSMDALTLTVIFGMGIQLLVTAFCCRGHFSYTAGLRSAHTDTAAMVRITLPILLGNSVVQLNTIVDEALASTLPDGSLSALSYANSLNALIISVFITSLSTVLYPTLTSIATGADMEQYGKTLVKCLSGLTFVLAPIACITMLTADDVVQIVYARGSFDQTAVAYTSVVLLCYAPQFLFAGIREVLTRAFFALQDTKTPTINSSISVVFNIVFSLVFVRFFGLSGIALGTSLSVLLSVVLLAIAACRRLPVRWLGAFLRQFALQMAATCISGLAVVLLHRFCLISGALPRFAVSAAVGFLVYLLVFLVVAPAEAKKYLQPFLKLLKR